MCAHADFDLRAHAGLETLAQNAKNTKEQGNT